MISIITRVQYRDLYQRLMASAFNTAVTGIEFFSEVDESGRPEITKTYNRLGKMANGEILVFCHDDIEFLETGWDARLLEFFAESDYDIAGVVGADKYDGGYLVAAGHPHCFGKFVNRSGSDLKINIYSRKSHGKKLLAVDGMFMAVRSDYFKREKFDEKLDGLFFYDIDYCLRGKTGLIDMTLAHYKPADRWGKYPKNMVPMESFEPYFYTKHNLCGVASPGDTRALCASQEDYANIGHDELFRLFEEKYLAKVA